MGEVQTDESHLVSWLVERDIKCPVCEYNLRNLDRAQCPECSAALGLAVASPNLNMAPWFVAVISLAMGAGFDGVVSVLATTALVIFTPKSPAERMESAVFLGTFLLLTGVSAVCLFLGYRSRRRWAFRTRRRQWWTAAAIVGATVLGHGVVGAFLAWRLN